MPISGHITAHTSFTQVEWVGYDYANHRGNNRSNKLAKFICFIFKQL
jgi:hypothetical protein